MHGLERVKHVQLFKTPFRFRELRVSFLLQFLRDKHDELRIDKNRKKLRSFSLFQKGKGNNKVAYAINGGRRSNNRVQVSRSLAIVDNESVQTV